MTITLRFVEYCAFVFFASRVSLRTVFPCHGATTPTRVSPSQTSCVRSGFGLLAILHGWWVRVTR